MMTKIKSHKIVKKLKKYYGEITVPLDFSNIYELTISVVLSAHTTDRQVNRVSKVLFKRFPNFKRLSEAETGEIESIIKSVGLYKAKAKNIISLSKMVVNEYNIILPDEIHELMKLPGIGRKSANVILAMGFNKAAFPVDTHILRIANRLGYVKSQDPFKAEIALTDFIPEKNWIECHLLFIKHGRTLCTARKPLCSECPVNRLCEYANTSDSIS